MSSGQVIVYVLRAMPPKAIFIVLSHKSISPPPILLCGIIIELKSFITAQHGCAAVAWLTLQRAAAGCSAVRWKTVHSMLHCMASHIITIITIYLLVFLLFTSRASIPTSIYTFRVGGQRPWTVLYNYFFTLTPI